MKRVLIVLGTAAAALALTAVAATSAGAATPVTTTTTAAVDVAGTRVDLPALNGQFTTMMLTVDGGNSTFGPDADMVTWYADGVFGANDDGWWTEGHGYGNLLANGVHAGAIVYSTDNGVTWNQLLSGAQITKDQGTHVVLAYNDIPGQYGDNTGPGYTVTVQRFKA